MSEPIIEKGITPPINLSSLFAQMELGDSIYFDSSRKDSAATTARTWFRQHQKKCMVRSEGEGVRIWRVK